MATRALLFETLFCETRKTVRITEVILNELNAPQLMRHVHHERLVGLGVVGNELLERGRRNGDGRHTEVFKEYLDDAVDLSELVDVTQSTEGLSFDCGTVNPILVGV